ncbi:hypothetical protein ABLE92_06960 [Gordonia sp. VNQ95]|uniref:DUF3885 domain-containing protein n=1 Tax=Gordonia sp. VNQ95 TaxID=3156619 RepID=UPI0032B56171
MARNIGGVVADFDDVWRSRRGDLEPIGHLLRYRAGDTWVRFHTLPGAKRFPRNDAERRTVFSRHRAVLSELCSVTATSPQDLRVMTSGWSSSPEPAGRSTRLVAAFGESAYWRSLLVDDDTDHQWWQHIYIGTSTLGSPRLRALLRLVADDRAGDVVITSTGAEWLYHPYDGGGDVIAPTQAIRDGLRDKFFRWLPPNAEGL